jgi:hypothetical protein
MDFICEQGDENKKTLEALKSQVAAAGRAKKKTGCFG